MNTSAERRAWSTSGYLIFVAFLALLVAGAYRWQMAAADTDADQAPAARGCCESPDIDRGRDRRASP